MTDRLPLLEAYRGYGANGRAMLTGRLYRQPASGGAHLRRLRRRGIADVSVEAILCGGTASARTDADGYFRLRWGDLPSDAGGWQSVAFGTPDADVVAGGTAEIFLRPPTSAYVVISDIDDTVMVTGVANKAAMYWRLFFRGADRRRAFPGTAAFYTALRHGASGADDNPVLFVSRGPWSIHDVLARFFADAGIAEKPILLLREWGLTLQSPLPRRAPSHKRDLVEEAMEIFGDADYVLIGDNGQHDPALYAAVAAAHPGRIRAVYIRDIAGTGRGLPDGAPVESLVSGETEKMAAHAAGLGLIRR